MAAAGQPDPPLLHHLSVSPSPSSSSSSTAESNFRELDDVFLQTQTRIWLGEVLQIRLDEQMNISDLLADGELLFEASRVVWKLLLKNRMDLRHTKAYKYEPFASRKSSGKYMPYSNVDSFLKICKILGLTGIDLFTPSDVVEKKNTRKVCMCIRSLTKKARSKNLNVPDFDIVTYTVAMPTNKVGWIRRSLERSQFSVSSSASDNSRRSSRSKSIQNNLVSASPRSYDSDSEESDEAESNPTVLQSDSSPLNRSNDASCQTNTILEYLPSLASGNLEFDILNNDKVESKQLQSELVGSLYMDHDFGQHDMSSPTCIDSIISFSDNGVSRNSENGLRDLNDVDVDLGYGVSAVEDCIDAKTPMNSIDKNSNDCCFQIHGDDSSLFGREDSNGFQSNSSHGSNSTQRNLENGFRRFSDDDLELSSTANTHSLSEAMRNLDFYDHVDAKDDFGTICSYTLRSPDTDLPSSKTIRDDTSPDPVETLMQNIVSNSVKPSIDTGVANLFILCTDSQSHTNGYTDNVSFENGVSVSRINPAVVQDEAKISQDENPVGVSDVDERCMVTMASMGNNGLELPSDFTSPEEYMCCSETGEAKDTIQMVNLKSIVPDNYNDPFNATMSESVSNVEKLTGNHLQAFSLNDIVEVCPPKSVVVEGSEKDRSTDGGGFQCEDTTIVGENGYSIDRNGGPCSESMDKRETELGSWRPPLHEIEQGTIVDVNVEAQNSKPRRRPSLKSVVKGTALVSMLFIAFHLRRNQIGAVAGTRGESSTTEASHVQKTNGVKVVSLRKGQQKPGIYPAEKLNFW